MTVDRAIDFLTESQPWMSRAAALALIVDAFNRFSSQEKYHGYKTVKTHVDIQIRIYARDERQAKDRLSVISEWLHT